MKEQLDQLVNRMVTVIVPIRNNVSISIRGILSGYGNTFHIPGNPSVIFQAIDVAEVDALPDTDVPVIRLS